MAASWVSCQPFPCLRRDRQAELKEGIASLLFLILKSNPAVIRVDIIVSDRTQAHVARPIVMGAKDVLISIPRVCSLCAGGRSEGRRVMDGNNVTS